MLSADDDRSGKPLLAPMSSTARRHRQEGMALFCKPFTTAKIRYFDHTKADEAKAWLESDATADKVTQPGG